MNPADGHGPITRRRLLGGAGLLGAAYAAGTRAGLSGLLDELGGASAALAASCAKLTPDLTEGPYWVDVRLHRFDVRANTAAASQRPGVRQQGVPLRLTINVYDAHNGCAPLDGAWVDIWHANAHGLYSDEGSQRAGGGTTGTDTAGEDYLRGYQITGRDAGANGVVRRGQVSFDTIWPGWYDGRAIHIHVRIRTFHPRGAAVYNYTTQIFFSDGDNDRVLTGAASYNRRSPSTDPTTDENDSVLTSADDATNVVAVTGSLTSGFAATFNVMLDTAGQPTQSGGGAGSSGSPPGGGAQPPGAPGSAGAA